MTLKAPNGKPSNLNPVQYDLVRTSAFKAWFGDWEKLAMAKLKDAAMDEVTLGNLSKDVSKVLDENGEPLVVYHTVKEKYEGWTKFKTVNDIKEIGSHFGTLEQAQTVAKNSVVDNPKMFICFLNIKNPLKVDDMVSWEAPTFKLIFKKNKIEYQESGNFLGNQFMKVEDVYDALSSKNIDGLMYCNIYEGSGLSYSVFFSNQIKLADGTNATFDNSNPDIRFNNGGEVDKSVLKDFSNNIEAYQSNHYGSFNRDKLVEIYMSLPISVKQKIQPQSTKNLFRGADGFDSKKSAISFTKNKDYAKFFGAYTIPFYVVEKHEGLIDTRKLSNYLYDLGIQNEIGDDEGEVIVINPIFKKDLKAKIENYRFNNGGKMKSVSNGTITVGASHDDGGIPVYNKGTGQMLEVEGGEGIINKRSMALKKEVTLNGDKMTPCEAASEINQMAGGVAYNCDNAKSSKETYNNGGEFKKGRKMEAEHKPTLDKLYKHEINPKKAVDEIVKEHLSENPKYYSTEGKWTPARRKKAKYSREKKYFDMGGMSEDFDFGLGSLDSFVNSKISPADRDTPDQEIIDWTITKGRELLDTDILQEILKNIDAKWKPYFMTYQTFNLYKLGWRLQFGSSRQWAGLCSWDGKISKNIYLSIQFVKHDKNWQQNAIDTIQHEIAHACVTEGIISKVGQAAFNMIDPMYAANTGHGDSWKSICQAINLKGDCSVFYSNSDLKPSFRPFKYECVNCRDKGYGNKWGFTSNCFKCFKPVVVTKNI